MWHFILFCLLYGMLHLADGNRFQGWSRLAGVDCRKYLMQYLSNRWLKNIFSFQKCGSTLIANLNISSGNVSDDFQQFIRFLHRVFHHSQLKSKLLKKQKMNEHIFLLNIATEFYYITL